MKKIIPLLFIVLSTLSLFAQEKQIHGTIYGLDAENKKTPLAFANIIWLGTQTGAVSGEKGFFEIKYSGNKHKQLIISYVGYKTDTILVTDMDKKLEVFLVPVVNLEEVNIEGNRAARSISSLTTINTESISSDGLQRLACCSLAESFETTATIDVGYADAVSGAKKIKMLGLAGVYSQILTELVPSARILSSTFGLNYIPGPWMNGISISKGTSSVSHGYESITGQINIDYKQPENSEKLYAELFINEHQRAELNASSAFKLSDKLSSIVLIHASGLNNKVDNNGDGFLDLPTGNLFIVSNRYHFNNKNKLRGRFGFEVLKEDRVGGQLGYNTYEDIGTSGYYGISVKSDRFTIYEKTGYLLDPDNNGSIAINASFVYHSTKSNFGLRKYDATQKSLNLKLKYKTELGRKDHKLNTGIDFLNDNFDQHINDTIIDRNEAVPGIFGEYIYSTKKLTIIGGLRFDYNNLYGSLFTPRLHIKYGISENATIRASAGKGYRTANVFPENIGLLASSRTFYFLEEFQIEEAWNYGINYTQKWYFDDIRNLTLNIDFYRTDFQNQIVVDINHSASAVYFYNLKGESFSNSFQTDLIIAPSKRFDITLAYRYNDVKVTMGQELINKPMVSPHKGLISLHYSTKFEKWNFTVTTQFKGQSKLPYTKDNPVEYQLGDTSPAYMILHAQILRKFSKWEFYLGAENLTNYKQQNPILAADDPFGDYFDSSIVWGPVVGRSINAGLRFKVK
jgi:outer membrane receptor protein involved in Fe transport